MLQQSVKSTVSRYIRAFPEDEPLGTKILELVALGASATSRKEFRGHITCGGVVVSVHGDLLMIKHRKLNRWLLPGGHIEAGDATLLDAARREVHEETGLPAHALLPFLDWPSDLPIHIDWHPIPENKAIDEPLHWHFDFRYLFECRVSVSTIQLDEVTDWAWAPMSRGPNVIEKRIDQIRCGKLHERL